MNLNQIKTLNTARRIAEFNCLFNHRYKNNVLEQDADLNANLLKDRDKLNIIIKNEFNGIDTDTLLSSPQHFRSSKVDEIIEEIEFLSQG